MRLADLLRAQIESGELEPGEQLPSIHKLANDHDLSAGTVQKALRILKAEGLIVGTHGYGTFVAERPGQDRA